MSSPPKLPARLSRAEVTCLIFQVDTETEKALHELEYARPIADDAGLTVKKSVLDSSFFGGEAGAVTSTSVASATGSSAASSTAGPVIIGGDPVSLEATDIRDDAAAAAHARSNFNPLRGTLSAFPFVLSTTGGHSNVDHLVQQTPDGSVDRLSEYKLLMRRRIRRLQPEERGADRWDLPRIPGGRRRRIPRHTDAAAAPPEPPPTGYILFITQMTCKLRHDNPGRRHDQISAVRRISSMWNTLPDKEREHYILFAKIAREEYVRQLREFRATGGWKPSESFERLGSPIPGGPWVRIPYDAKCKLEKEIDSYDQVTFPPRPPEMDDDYNQRMKESVERRKKKVRDEKRKYL